MNELFSTRTDSICPLSTSDRDSWAKSREMLVKIGENAKSLDDVDHGMMCLTLDNYAYTSPGMKNHKKP